MRTLSFLLPAAIAVVFTSCNSGDDSAEASGDSNDSAVGADANWAIEPCRCYEEGLREIEVERCREGKRDSNFLVALKKCSDKGITPTSAINNAPLDGEYRFDRKTSMIHWTGRKIAGEHSGSIKIRSGVFTMTGGTIIGGEIVVEMGTIQSGDLKGEDKTNLEGHLRSDDFFGTKEHPTATFALHSSKMAANGGVEVSGTLTIKGESQPAKALLHFAGGEAVVATVKMIFDRTDFGIRYGSGSFFDDLGDQTINDEVALKMLLVESFEDRKGL
jgi:polyisoprenoid-binding protein YceI